MQRLIGAVRPAVRVLDPRDEDLGIREHLLQVCNKGNGASHSHPDRFDSPRAAEGLECDTGGWRVSVCKIGVAPLPRGEVEFGPEGYVSHEVAPYGFHCCIGILPWCEAQAELRAGRWLDRVRRHGDGGHVDADDRQGGSAPEPRGDASAPCQPDAVEHSRVGSILCFRVLHFGIGGHDEAGDGYVPFLVMERRDEPGQKRRRVQHGASEDPGVDGVAQHADPEGAVHESSQARRERGGADGPVARVRNHDDVGRESFAVRVEEFSEARRSCFLLALDEERDTHPGGVAQDFRDRAPSRQMDHDPRFVVRCAATEQAPAADLRGERRGVPEREVSRWLHVMVGVEQDGRPAWRRGAAGDDGRSTGLAVRPFRSEDFSPVEARGGGQLGDGLRAALELRRVEGIPCDAGDGGKRHELCECGVEPAFDGVTDLGDDVRREGWGI